MFSKRINIFAVALPLNSLHKFGIKTQIMCVRRKKKVVILIQILGKASRNIFIVPLVKKGKTSRAQ